MEDLSYEEIDDSKNKRGIEESDLGESVDYSDQDQTEKTMALSEFSITLELGDIIEILAPTNRELHEITAYITYIDQQQIKLLNTATNKLYQLNINDEGQFTDESITQVNLLSRSEEPGYARQNGLLPRTWIDIYFGGDIPAIITGEITNLEEDMIEITTYPELRVIYINFEYKGIPEYIPIEKIILRQKPAALGKVGSLSLLRQQLEEGEELDVDVFEKEQASVEFTPTGESIITIPEGAKPDENIREVLQELYVDANSIVFGERLEALAQVVEVPEGEQRYSIDVQVNDLMDELLSTIPNSQRTKQVMDNIHLLIERFKSLRSQFSKFDANENVYDSKTVGAYYKPLVERIQRVDRNLRWLIPVVSTRRKICIDATDELLDTPDITIEDFNNNALDIASLQEDYYKKNLKDHTVEYGTMNKRIQEWMRPINPPLHLEENLTTTKVLTDLDTIVDNLEDFYSTVAGVEGTGKNQKVYVTKQQYVIQRYNLGLSRLEENIMKSGKTVYLRNGMTPNDDITIKSILMMPMPVIQWSVIDMPTTSILQRAELHQTWLMLFRILRKNTGIIPRVIEDLSKEFDYEQIEKEIDADFLSQFNEFVLDKDVFVDQEEKFQKFLEAIIPKTRFLIRLARKYIKDKVSFVSIVQKLEPFMVYPGDITYKQYMEIRYIIKERIREYKKSFEQKGNEFAILRNTDYGISPKTNSILRLLSENEKFAEAFFQTYRFLSKDKANTTLSPQEVILRMANLDNGQLYNNVLTSIMISLMTPNNLSGILNAPAKLDDVTDMEKVKPTDCTRRYLAKEYTSLRNLQKDNGVEELYYDKDYDDTPYGILKKYEKQQKEMMPDLFLEFLMENLVHNHDCPKANAEDLAKTLIAKKKLVEDGDYAVLEIKPHLPEDVDESKLTLKDREAIESEAYIRKKVQYYRRLKNNWVRDDSISEESFLDTNTIFCNVSANCYKNPVNAVCESTDDAATRMKEIAKRKMLAEFDKRYAVNVEELEQELEKNVAYFLKMLKKTQVLQEIQLCRANNLAFELGNLASKDEILSSPYMKLRDLILGQDDFSKKQADICRFVETYCRKPMITELEESPAWLYCKETNVKLFPASIHELAQVFISGGDYTRSLNEVSQRVGILSDDGDSIVDKYSGFVIRKIDFSEEEGFNEAGFRITTHDIIEKDLGAVVLEAIGKKEKRVFENEMIEKIYNVFTTICLNIDIHSEGITDFILRTSSEIAEKNILSEATYQKQSEANKKKTGNPFKITYVNYRNETTIMIVACVLLVAIQTATPSFQTKRTFPGCVRSFSGYPMDGVEDLTGIQYLACVINKSKSSIPPWDSIKKYTVEILTKRMKDIIERTIMKRSDIMDLYTQKREYNILHPELVVPEEHSIAKWRHFLPPVVDFTILSKIHSISSTFKHDLMEMFHKGHRDQHESIAVLKSKLIYYGYGLIETINNAVKSKDMLLKTTSKIPFLENACCNDRPNAANPLKYFNEEDETIFPTIRAAYQLSILLYDIRQATTASTLYHPGKTGITYPTIPFGHLEENIYAAVLWYCNFDRDVPIPEEFKLICNEKPAEYNKSWSIQEKMDYLKRIGKQWNVENLHQLMTLVYQKNIVDIRLTIPFSQIDILKEVIESLDMSNSTIIAEPLRKHLRNIIDKYDPLKMTEINSKELDGLTDYLVKTNENLYKTIMKFFDKHGNLSSREYQQLHEFLSNIQNWSLDKPMSETKKYYDDGLYMVTQFIKNAIENLTKIYPSVLFNDADFYKNIPAHWNLSSAHQGDISKFLNKQSSQIEKFKGDSILLRLLQAVRERLADVNLFISNLPVQTEVVVEVDEEDGSVKPIILHGLFDKYTIYQLFSYCFYSVLYEYITCSSESEFLRADLQETKQTRREKIQHNADPANRLYGIREEELDEAAETRDDALQEVELITGNKEELQARVASLVLAFLHVERDTKSMLNLSYEEVMQRTRRSKDKEKQGIIKYLGDMSIQERRIEDMFKNYRIGRWNVGQQSGLIEYDKDTYDRERNELLQQLYEDVEGGNQDVVTEMMMDIYELDQFDKNAADAEGEEEMYGIGDLGEDFMDGQYYAEDRDDDFHND